VGPLSVGGLGAQAGSEAQTDDQAENPAASCRTTRHEQCSRARFLSERMSHRPLSTAIINDLEQIDEFAGCVAGANWRNYYEPEQILRFG
ncbi:MAG TPA: hypothetical protein VGY58_07210, partial [Gemmataceae bacterium]|nr:hypothetical protein [Gemmataceae bacterium]